MPISHHHHLLPVAANARCERSIRIDGVSYPATSRGSIAEGAGRRFAFSRRRSGGSES